MKRRRRAREGARGARPDFFALTTDNQADDGDLSFLKTDLWELTIYQGFRIFHL